MCIEKHESDSDSKKGFIQAPIGKPQNKESSPSQDPQHAHIRQCTPEPCFSNLYTQ